METVELGEDTFTKTIEDNDIVLIDFLAEWCGPCKSFSPVFEKVSEEFPGVVFGKVNTEEEQQIAGSFSITSIPTLMAIRDNVVLYAEAGALPEPALRDLVTRVQDVDMDAVRSEIAKQAETSGDTE